MKVINPFVYEYIRNNNAPNPTIPAWIHETYSQSYEDIIISCELGAYQYRNGLMLDSDNLTYIEVGANHPVCTSSTYLISKTFNVNGFLVEPNPKLAEQLRKYRTNDNVIEAAVVTSEEKEVDFFICSDNEISSIDKKFVDAWAGISRNYPGVQEKIKVKTARINEILSYTKDKKIVILSIDVEGMDLQILKDIDFSTHRPYIIVVEPSEAYIPGNTQNMVNYLSHHDYRLISANFVNLIFADATRE
jgi:FkbM family methyltransferase